MAAQDSSSDGPSDLQDETLITQHTLTALDLRTAVWTVTLLPTEGPHGWSTRRLASSGAQDGAPPIARKLTSFSRVWRPSKYWMA